MNPRFRKFAYAANGQLLYEENTANNSLSEHVYLGGSLIATRSSISTIPNGQPTVTYAHTDALGSPVAKTDQAGVVQDRTSYEPYGTAINKPTYEGIGYTGHVQDGASGLTYMQQRYYDPGIGRFLSVDPVTALGQPGQNFNRYVYASNSPYNFKDPDGRDDEWFTNVDPMGNPGGGNQVGPVSFTVSASTFGAVMLVAAGPAIGTAALANPVATTNLINGTADAIAGTSVTVSGASAVAKSGYGVQIVEQAGNTVELVGNGAKGAITVIADMAKKGKDLLLEGAHVSGAGKGSSSLRELRGMARELGRQQGAENVIIKGGIRTTGANPGKKPIDIKVKVEP